MDFEIETQMRLHFSKPFNYIPPSHFYLFSYQASQYLSSSNATTKGLSNLVVQLRRERYLEWHLQHPENDNVHETRSMLIPCNNFPALLCKFIGDGVHQSLDLPWESLYHFCVCSRVAHFWFVSPETPAEAENVVKAVANLNHLTISPGIIL